MAEAAQGYTSTDWIDPSKIGPPHWLHSEDAFQQMLARAGSGELAADDLYAWLRSRDWLSVELRVSADGEKTCRRLPANFYRDIAWLEAVPDADAVDHLEIHYPDRVDDWHTSFWVRAAEFARELERLYPAILYPTTAAPPSTAAAPAVSEVATQDASPGVQGVDPFNSGADGRPTAINQPTVTPTRKKRQSKKQTRVIAALRELDSKDRVPDDLEPAEVEKMLKPYYRDASRRVFGRAYKVFLDERSANKSRQT
jgi:hypothetical protein